MARRIKPIYRFSADRYECPYCSAHYEKRDDAYRCPCRAGVAALSEEITRMRRAVHEAALALAATDRLYITDQVGQALLNEDHRIREAERNSQ